MNKLITIELLCDILCSFKRNFGAPKFAKKKSFCQISRWPRNTAAFRKNNDWGIRRMIKNFSFSLSYFYSTLITMWDRALSRREIKRSYSSYRLFLILRTFLFTSRREENMEQRFFEIWSTFLIIRQIKRRISENNDKIHDESTLPIFPFFFLFPFLFFYVCTCTRWHGWISRGWQRKKK